MVIRPKYHWMSLALASCWIPFGIYVHYFKNHPSDAEFYFVSAGLLLALWATTFTTLEDGVLKKRIFLMPIASFPVGDIRTVEPHKKNGKWSYGTVVNVWSVTGEKITLQPNKPVAFLKLLREQVPQAEFVDLP